MGTVNYWDEATQSWVKAQAPQVESYTKTETDALLDGTYTKEEIDERFATQAAMDALTAADVGAVSKVGDTMTGSLKQIGNNVGYGMTHTNTNMDGGMYQDSNSVALYHTDVSGDNSNRRILLLQNATKMADLAQAIRLLSVVGGANKHYKIFGEHNKPSGSYTGNGDATARTIEIGGIGGVVLITGAGNATLVTVVGGVTLNTDGTIGGIPYTECHVTNDGLYLATTNARLNTNGTAYAYQRL